MDKLTIVLVILGCGGYVAYQWSKRWKAAGTYVEAMNSREDLTQRDFEAMRSEPRYVALLARVGTNVRIADDPNDATAHRVVYARFVGARNETILVEGSADAPWLMVYLAGPGGLRQYAQNLKTGEITETPIGAMAASSVLPMWARR